MLRRLRHLEHGKWIARVTGLPSGELAWRLTAYAAGRLGCESSLPRINRNTLVHDILLSDVRFSLARVGLGENWTSEILLRRKAWEKRKSSSVEEGIPDAVLTVKAKGEYHAVALELELHPKNRQRYRKIFRSYAARQTLAWVWYIVPHARLGERLEREWSKVSSFNRYIQLVWSLLPEVLDAPWEAKIHSAGTVALLSDRVELKTPACSHPRLPHEHLSHAVPGSPSAADPSPSTR